MGSAIGPAFTYLLTNLPATLEAVGDGSIAVVDGWATTLPDDIFVLGRNDWPDQEASAGTHALQLIGGELVEEEFIIPCFIDCFRGGDEQKQARDAALAYLDAFVKFLASDRTLGGALLNGRYARLDALTIDGPVPDETSAGRRCQIKFSIRCQNQYNPFA